MYSLRHFVSGLGPNKRFCVLNRCYAVSTKKNDKPWQDYIISRIFVLPLTKLRLRQPIKKQHLQSLITQFYRCSYLKTLKGLPWKEHHTIFWIIISDEIKWNKAAEQANYIEYFTRFRGRGTHKQYFTIKLLFKLRFFSLYNCLHNLIVLTFEVWHYMNNGHNHTVNSLRQTPLELAQVSILERFPS